MGKPYSQLAQLIPVTERRPLISVSLRCHSHSQPCAILVLVFFGCHSWSASPPSSCFMPRLLDIYYDNYTYIPTLSPAPLVSQPLSQPRKPFPLSTSCDIMMFYFPSELSVHCKPT